jgi:hypothetical protein
MSDQFMDFYGCPALVIEYSQRPYWKGTTLPSKNPQKYISTLTNEGLYFDDAKDMDFDNPVTDYDRICKQTIGLRKSASLIDLENSDRKGLALHINKDSITWLDDMEMFAWIETLEDENFIEQDLDLLLTVKLKWEYETEWDIKESKLLLFNSAFHANAKSLIDDEKPDEKALMHDASRIINIKPALYTLSSAIHDTPYGCYRVVKMEK